MLLRSTLTSMFEAYGIKTVSKTDRSKGAYVLNVEQEDVLKRAGKLPDPNRPAESFQIEVLGDDQRKTVEATYYHAVREGAGRAGEPRLGREIISRWLQEGDELFLATDGSNVFAAKLDKAGVTSTEEEKIKNGLVTRLSDDYVRTKAKEANKQAKKITTTSVSYIRNPYVIEAAKRRADGNCEMPGCKYEPFVTESGSPYLEGHHIQPLSEGGEDSLTNVAALCPNCHREQHFSEGKLNIKEILRAEISQKMK